MLGIGETTEVWGSGSKPYVLKNCDGTVFSCSCPSWRNKGGGVMRTCKHLIKLNGREFEEKRIGAAVSAPVKKSSPKKVSPGCACETGGFCDVSHDPATCPCKQCTTAEAKPVKVSVLLAEAWDDSMDPTGWWMSEKLDGVRAYWDGKDFLSRNGNKFYAPEEFKVGLPNHPLDGELWMGRKAFQKTISVVRSQSARWEAWKNVTYVIFDSPSLRFPFEGRMAALRALDPKGGCRMPWARVHEHVLCTGFDHLKRELSNVEGMGGEGMMLRRAGSLYEARRSSTLLKVKTFHDLEVTVVGHKPGKGKHKGRLGGLVCRLDNGKQLNVGTGLSDAERSSPPPIGSRVTITFTELTNSGIPKCAAFLRVRKPE